MKIRIEKRLKKRWQIDVLVFVISLALAFVIGGILMACMGIPPLQAYRQMLGGAFGSAYGLSETLVKAIPLMIMGLAVAIAFRMVLWNIGAEGQYCIGALFACGIALAMPKHHGALMIPLIFAAGFFGGALWGAIAGALKAYFRANEIITTLMMNYIAIHLLDYLVYGPWKDPGGYNFPMTAVLGAGAHLPQLGSTRIHLGLLLAIALIIIFDLVMKRTKWGFEVRVVGENPEAAPYAGMNIRRNIILVMLVSGGLAGLAGVCELAGLHHRLQHGFAVGYGYTAIIIAWLSKLNPVSTVLVSFLFAGLMVSSDVLQISMGTGAGLGGVLQGIILFFVLAGGLFTDYRIVIRKEKNHGE
jgi:general nucleoside transport system permease protein